MKILMIVPKLPFPPTDGGRIAVFEPIRHLYSRGHDITLVSLEPMILEESVINNLKNFCNVEYITHDTRSNVLLAFANLFSSIPYTISKYISGDLSNLIRNLLIKGRFDLVHIETLHMSFYHTVADEFNVPVILRQQNVESQLAERYAITQKGYRRLYARLHAAKMKRYEIDMCSKMHLCLAITPEDAAKMQSLNKNIRTRVVPAGVNLKEFSPQKFDEEPYSIVSVAAMDWLPNIDGIVWFCNNVLPIVQKIIPQTKLYVVGKNPPKQIKALSNSNIIVTGFVDDVREYIAKSAVSIVPLRSGGGMRLKILQAMAMEKAIVSTTLGAEGISVSPGENILIADEPLDFARAIIDLFNNSTIRRSIGNKARYLVEKHYSWEHVVSSLEQEYARVISGSF